MNIPTAGVFIMGGFVMLGCVAIPEARIADAQAAQSALLSSEPVPEPSPAVQAAVATQVRSRHDQLEWQIESQSGVDDDSDLLDDVLIAVALVDEVKAAHGLPPTAEPQHELSPKCEPKQQQDADLSTQSLSAKGLRAAQTSLR